VWEKPVVLMESEEAVVPAQPDKNAHAVLVSVTVVAQGTIADLINVEPLVETVLQDRLV
jgi:hypothetical protein